MKALKVKKHKKRDERKVRLCLLCKEEFESEWAGNRVCTKCKSKAIWRSGGTLSSY